MSTRLKRALGTFAVLCAAPCLAQRTWIVDELNRPGTDFLDIPPAVAAAAPGDIIRVRTDDRLPPWYTAPTLDGKGVQILGDPAGRPWVYGSWTIRNVPAGQEVVVADFDFGKRSIFLTTPGTVVGLRCQFNRGPLFFERIRYGMPWDGPFPYNICYGDAGIVFDQCDLVVISDSEVNSCSGIGAIWWTNLMLDRCTSHSWPIATFPRTSYAMVVSIQSRAWVSASVLQGHDAPTHNIAGKALRVCGDSHVWVGGGTQLIAGLNSGGRGFAVVGDASALCWVQLPLPVVHRDPSTVILGSLDTQYYIDAPGPVTGLEHTASSTNLRLVQHARPGAPLLLAAGELTSASWSVAGVPVWLDPMAPLILDFALAPANGQRTRDIPLPPGLSGARLGLQSFELLPSGELLASNATHVVIP